MHRLSGLVRILGATIGRVAASFVQEQEKKTHRRFCSRRNWTCVHASRWSPTNRVPRCETNPTSLYAQPKLARVPWDEETKTRSLSGYVRLSRMAVLAAERSMSSSYEEAAALEAAAAAALFLVASSFLLYERPKRDISG